MQDVKMVAKMFAKYNTNEKAYFLLWAGQAIGPESAANREMQMELLGRQLAKPEFKEASWLVRHMFSEMDRFEDERGPLTGPVTVNVKAKGFDREDNNGEFDVDMSGQVKFTNPNLKLAVAAAKVDERYQVALLKAKYGSNLDTIMASYGGEDKTGACNCCGASEGDLHDLTCPIRIASLHDAAELPVGPLTEAYISGAAKFDGPRMDRKLESAVEIDTPVVECEECKGTGVYTSQVTGDTDACSQGCKKP